MRQPALIDVQELRFLASQLQRHPPKNGLDAPQKFPLPYMIGKRFARIESLIQIVLVGVRHSLLPAVGIRTLLSAEVVFFGVR